MALAAFTFDVDEPGSVVMIPGTEAPYPDRTPPPPGRIVDDGRKRWWSGFDDALAALGSGEVEKVVLARRAVGRFETNLEPASVWRTLVDANPDTYCFLLDGFVGASPELLVRVDGDRVQSLALAGTAATEHGLVGEKIAPEHQHTADSVTRLGLDHSGPATSRTCTGSAPSRTWDLVRGRLRRFSASRMPSSDCGGGSLGDGALIRH